MKARSTFGGVCVEVRMVINMSSIRGRCYLLMILLCHDVLRCCDVEVLCALREDRVVVMILTRRGVEAMTRSGNEKKRKNAKK